MSSEQDKDLVAKKKCMLHAEHAEQGAERSYFLQSRERLPEDPAPLAQYAQPKMPLL